MIIKANTVWPHRIILGVIWCSLCYQTRIPLQTRSGCLNSRSPQFDWFCVRGWLALLSLTRPDPLPFLQRTSENKRQNWQLILYIQEKGKRKKESGKPCAWIWAWCEYQGHCLPRASSEVARQPNIQHERSMFLQHTTLRGISQCAVEKHTSEM